MIVAEHPAESVKMCLFDVHSNIIIIPLRLRTIKI